MEVGHSACTGGSKIYESIKEIERSHRNRGGKGNPQALSLVHLIVLSIFIPAGTSTVVNFFLIRRDGTTSLCFIFHLFLRNFRHGDSSKRYPWTWGMNIPIFMLCEFLGVYMLYIYIYQ